MLSVATDHLCKLFGEGQVTYFSKSTGTSSVMHSTHPSRCLQQLMLVWYTMQSSCVSRGLIIWPQGQQHFERVLTSLHSYMSEVGVKADFLGHMCSMPHSCGSNDNQHVPRLQLQAGCTLASSNLDSSCRSVKRQGTCQVVQRELYTTTHVAINTNNGWLRQDAGGSGPPAQCARRSPGVPLGSARLHIATPV